PGQPAGGGEDGQHEQQPGPVHAEGGHPGGGAHCGAGARAWVLAESCDGAVTVTVRDEGPGIPDGRLEQAAADGRMGVARSIRGRVAELGGRVSIVSVPGQGTEVEITVPV
ncbi:ATP-binding protein, partial [Nonomuraea fuscirosea]